MGNRKRILYKCDPIKNKNCKKNMCYLNNGTCNKTRNKEYAKEDEPDGMYYL